jgi:hypothetical protein
MQMEPTMFFTAEQIEAEAHRLADLFQNDVSVIRFQQDRWRFGSLSHQWNADLMRPALDRALALACERCAAPQLIAAE